MATLQGLMEDYYKGQTIHSDAGMNIATGSVPGASSYFKFGLNPSISTVQETVWEDGGLYVTPTVAGPASITSTSSLDNATGTGARSLFVQGLDENWLTQDEIIPLNGTGVVITQGDYIRLNRMYVVTAGSAAAAQGSISAIVDGKVVCSINDGANQSQLAHYTIPADKDGYLTAVYFAVGQGKEIQASIHVRTDGGVYRQTATSYLYQSIIDADFTVPRYIPPKADIELRAKSVSGTNAVNGSMTIVLLDR